MARFSVLVNEFDGGLNTKVKASAPDANLNESPDLQDVVYDDFGSVGTRLGREVLEASGIVSAPIDLLHSFFKDDGTRQLMAIAGESMYRFSGTTSVLVASSTSLFTQAVAVQAVNYQNQMFISNGGVDPYKYNGTEFTRWGIPVPSAPTAVVASDGTLTGFYKYVVLGINSNLVQGNFGSETAEVSATSNEITLSDIPVFPVSHGVNTKQVCRNTALASGLYLVVTEISNAQTSYTDVAADSELVTDAPLDQGLPPYFTTMLAHRQRIFGASKTSSNPTYLWYSLIDTPEVFPSENFLRIGDGDGEPIVGLGLVSNNIIIAKNDNKGNGSTWLLYMPDNNPINWTVAKLDAENGGQATNVMIKFGNFLAYINQFGIYDLSEFAVGDIRGDALSFNIEPDIYGLSNTSLNVSFAITWKNKVWFSVPFGSTQTTNNRIYQYDYIRGRSGTQRELGAWSRFSNSNFANFTVHDGELYGGSSAEDGKVFKLDTGRNDAGEAIDSYFKTMALYGAPEHRNHTKVWRFIYVTVEASGDWFMTIEILPNFALSGQKELINLAEEGAVYGTAIIDTDFWGGGLVQKRVKIPIKNAVSKQIQFKFSTNAVDEYFKVDEIEVFYNLRSLRSGDT